MMRPYTVSYKCALELIARGCPLDFVEHLPGGPSAHRKRLYIRTAGGYAEARIFDHGAGPINVVVPIVIGTDLPSGIVIDEWHFITPDPRRINWDFDLSGVIPEKDRHAYAELTRSSRLAAVLNDRRLLTRGHPVSGVLCGIAERPFEPTDIGPIHAEFSVTDDTGFTAKTRIALWVDRHMARTRTTVARTNVRVSDAGPRGSNGAKQSGNRLREPVCTRSLAQGREQ